MVAPVASFNPLLVTAAPGSFSVTSDGYIQGVALDDPAIRNTLAGGILAASETIPMWGGVAIFENIPGAAGQPVDNLGSLVGRATAVGGISGFSVFNQAAAWITSPQSEVPNCGSGMTVPFHRLGSGMRIAVGCDPALASLEGGAVGQQVSWDFGSQQLVQFNAAWPANVITASSWASTGGGQATYTTTTAHTVAVGEFFTISGETPAGYNGTFKAITGTTGSTLVAAMAVNPGASTVQGTLVAGGGALPVKVLGFNIGNSKTVFQDPATGFVHFNNAGSCAVILL
jgi:hypothetical protein